MDTKRPFLRESPMPVIEEAEIIPEPRRRAKFPFGV